ncbi:hypothetical protein OIN59_11450 [Acidovorax sp. D2M1]|uniref:YfhG lipoprotein n=1 Tax=Acidovorax benzenivorans TaxID=2987520 RepID=A0ABT5RWI1_9BURK|nr:hypothetical protein [Acidovorax benzenivorans]MDD2178050.1 hypothetical protein [Acidovorax benzenivorans]
MPPSPTPLPSCALRWPLLALGALLAGCASTPPPPAPAKPPPVAMIIAVPVAPAIEVGSAEARGAEPNTNAPVALLLTQTDRVLKLPPAELAKEIARLSEAEDATTDTPLLLATALAQTRQAVDTARALGLVQRVLSNTSTAAQPLHPLARLLEARLLQQRRLEDQLERQAQQLRDSQRRNDQLSERLEAVRAIERSLSTRPTPAPSPTPSAPAAPATSNGAAPRPAP